MIRHRQAGAAVMAMIATLACQPATMPAASQLLHCRILVRGRQLDGPHVVAFGQLLEPWLKWEAPAGSGAAWSSRQSTVRSIGPGCFGFQADGDGISQVIVLAAG